MQGIDRNVRAFAERVMETYEELDYQYEKPKR